VDNKLRTGAGRAFEHKAGIGFVIVVGNSLSSSEEGRAFEWKAVADFVAVGGCALGAAIGGQCLGGKVGAGFVVLWLGAQLCNWG